MHWLNSIFSAFTEIFISIAERDSEIISKIKLPAKTNSARTICCKNIKNMSEGSITPKEDEFMNISLNLGLYNPVLKDIYVDMGGKVEANKIKIRTTITDGELLEIYNRMEGEKND